MFGGETNDSFELFGGELIDLHIYLYGTFPIE